MSGFNRLLRIQNILKLESRLKSTRKSDSAKVSPRVTHSNVIYNYKSNNVGTIRINFY